MHEIWAFLGDPNNQETLAWLGGGLAVAVGACWTAFTYFEARKTPPANVAKLAVSARAATVRNGIAATGNLSVGGDLRIEQFRLPRGAILLAVLGLCVVLYGVLNARGSVSVNGSYVGGNVENSRIEVTPAAPAEP